MNTSHSSRISNSLEALENRIAPAGLIFAASKGIVNVYIDNGSPNNSPTIDGKYETLADSFTPFPGYTGVLELATGDFDGDGNAELVTSKAAGIASIKIWELTGGGRVAQLLDTITPALGKAKGATVASADLDGDGRDELVIGSGPGVAPLVLVAGDTDRDGLLSDETFDSLAPFTTKFKGGVKVADGNTNNVGGEEVIVAMGSAGGTIAVYSDVNSNRKLSDDAAGKLEEFTPFGPKYKGGVSVASGILENAGGGGAEIIAATLTGKPTITVFTDTNANGTVSDNDPFETFKPTGKGYTGGLNVAAGDTDGSGTFVELITAPAKGAVSTTRIYDDSNDTGAKIFDNDLDDEFAAFTKSAGVTLAFGKILTEDYTYRTVTAIPDVTTTTLRLNIAPGAGIVRDLNLGLFLTHTHTPDLDVTLTHNGVSVVLFTDAPNAISADGFMIRLDDEAVIDINDAPGVAGQVLSGSYNLEGSALLSAFDGMDASGEWVLTIVDDAGGDFGTLYNWSLSFGV